MDGRSRHTENASDVFLCVWNVTKTEDGLPRVRPLGQRCPGFILQMRSTRRGRSRGIRVGFYVLQESPETPLARTALKGACASLPV